MINYQYKYFRIIKINKLIYSTSLWRLFNFTITLLCIKLNWKNTEKAGLVTNLNSFISEMISPVDFSSVQNITKKKVSSLKILFPMTQFTSLILILLSTILIFSTIVIIFKIWSFFNHLLKNSKHTTPRQKYMSQWVKSIIISISTNIMLSRLLFKLYKLKIKYIKKLNKILKIFKNNQERFTFSLTGITKVFTQLLLLKIIKIWFLRKVKMLKFITIIQLKRLIFLLKLLVGIKNMLKI